MYDYSVEDFSYDTVRKFLDQEEVRVNEVRLGGCEGEEIDNIDMESLLEGLEEDVFLVEARYRDWELSETETNGYELNLRFVWEVGQNLPEIPEDYLPHPEGELYINGEKKPGELPFGEQ